MVASWNPETETGNEDFEKMKSAVKVILECIGEDPEREGLLDTPKRVAKAYLEMTSGLSVDPKRHLRKQFTTLSDSMVVVRDIPFKSMCEHHLLPFRGVASVAYIPGPTDEGEGYRIAGLSKFARAVSEYAARPQVQENLTSQVAEAVQEELLPQGCLVIMEATHMCMELRGVQSSGSATVTSAVTGIFSENKDGVKDEALKLIRDVRQF